MRHSRQLVSVIRRSAFGLTAAMILAGASAATAETIASNDIRQGLYSTCFVSDKEGWAVADLGRIFHTTDGAETWEIQSAGTKQPFVSVSCVDPLHVWVAGQSGQMARTSDGGKTWQMLKSGTDKQILSLRMFDDQKGIAVGDFGTILRTEDGGNNWTKISVPTGIKLPEDMEGIVEPGDIVLYGVTWAGPDFVAISGEFGVILVSNDGGRTFQSHPSGVEITLFGIFFVDNMRGWSVGMEQTLIMTHDGGVTWEKKDVKAPPGFSLALFDLEVRDNLGWAVGNSGYLLTSTDAGETWNLVNVPMQMGSYWFREVSLLSSGKGFTVGSTGIVLSLDGTNYKAHKKQL